MPTWLQGVLQWAVGLALQHVSAADVKKELATLFTALDVAVQAAESKIKGPFEAVADEVALAFHESCVAIVEALNK